MALRKRFVQGAVSLWLLGVACMVVWAPAKMMIRIEGRKAAYVAEAWDRRCGQVNTRRAESFQARSGALVSAGAVLGLLALGVFLCNALSLPDSTTMACGAVTVTVVIKNRKDKRLVTWYLAAALSGLSLLGSLLLLIYVAKVPSNQRKLFRAHNCQHQKYYDQGPEGDFYDFRIRCRGKKCRPPHWVANFL